MMGWMAGAGAYQLLLGRGTYEIFAAHWPYVTDGPIGDQLNGTGKHVASTTLEQLEWNNSTLITGDVADLFGDGTIPAGLRLVDSKVSTTGVTINTYERAGGINYGSFA
jgi:dihydrofolate reductase